jgi:hypothetical protein
MVMVLVNVRVMVVHGNSRRSIAGAAYAERALKVAKSIEHFIFAVKKTQERMEMKNCFETEGA